VLSILAGWVSYRTILYHIVWYCTVLYVGSRRRRLHCRYSSTAAQKYSSMAVERCDGVQLINPVQYGTVRAHSLCL
jgi:hypothetical protein